MKTKLFTSCLLNLFFLFAQPVHAQDVVLERVYPNVTSIRFGIPDGGGGVRLEVFDLLGRKVATLVDQALPAGWQTVTFDAGNLNSGIYIYRLEAAGQTIVRKMMLVK
ncbi:MAG: T9SS type A sorting domain-containing protein [Cyclonatronaceae bacterium]